jgi:hypothetical protein
MSSDEDVFLTQNTFRNMEDSDPSNSPEPAKVSTMYGIDLSDISDEDLILTCQQAETEYDNTNDKRFGTPISEETVTTKARKR